MVSDMGFIILWRLKTNYTFSFASYFNPNRLRFGVLRVFNDDIVGPGKGFGTHPHDNMEIISIPIEGALAHRDSTGNEHVIHPNEIQIMSAGTGLTHSEFNHSDTDEVNFLQLWIIPKEKNIEPRYDQKLFDPSLMVNKMHQLVFPDANGEALSIHQDAYISMGRFGKSHQYTYERHIEENGMFFFLIEGNAYVDTEFLDKRDAIGIEDSESVTIDFRDQSTILAVEVPMN